MSATLLPPIYWLYRGLTTIAAPLAIRAARKRFEARDGPMERFGERNGHATCTRPDGRLIWMHAVSVGEFLSILDLVGDMAQAGPTILVTTTTSSAADLARQRLPQGVIHQFAPLDTPQATRRFLDHWRPDLAVFVESEIWPNQIVMTHSRGIPLALINARLSGKSLEKWKKSPKFAKAFLTRFTRIMTQTKPTRDALHALGAPAPILTTTGDMKAASSALPFDVSEAEQISQAIGQRPAWVASSTHEGEEGAVSAAHRLVTANSDTALLILVPRHPERGDAVELLLKGDGWQVARRSKGEPLTAETQIYLADTLGETGLWYHLSPIVFVAGSFSHVGGHNPYEPAHFGCAILHGPNYANFELAYGEMTAAKACLETEDSTALGLTVAGLLTGNRQKELANNARAFVDTAGNNRAHVADTLLSLVK